METKKENLFEAGKIAYHCIKCDTNMMLYPEQPKVCPCGSMELIEVPNNEVYVIIGIYQGCLEDVKVFTDPEKATEYEKTLCKELEVPYDAAEREEYYDSNGENEVHHMITKLE